MEIFIDTTVPYKFDSLEKCYKYVILRCHNIKKSLRFIEKDTEQLCVRCPVSGDYLEIFGTAEEINSLDKLLSKNNWYRIT